MIRFPALPVEAVRLPATLRAGGTDVEDRRRNGLLHGDITDLRDLNLPVARALDTIGGLNIGALCRISQLDVPLLDPWPGLREAAATLATPQIRAMATVGGSLLQANRCWYRRHHHLAEGCHKAGGDSCPAREGDALRHALFDVGPCVSVHPSTLGCALLAWDALVTVLDRDGARVWGGLEDLFGDGSDPTRDHQLPADTLLQAVHLAPADTGERSVYARATGRQWAEWPLVELTVRRTRAGFVVAGGGLAPVPLRLRTLEMALSNGAGVEAALAAELSARKLFDPTRYKAKLLEGLLKHLLARLEGDS